MSHTHKKVGNFHRNLVPKSQDLWEKENVLKPDFWIDVLMRLSKALTKVTLGRVRGRFTQSNALWVSDAETMRTEGNTELSELRAYLQANTQLLYGID